MLSCSTHFSVVVLLVGVAKKFDVSLSQIAESTIDLHQVNYKLLVGASVSHSDFEVARVMFKGVLDQIYEDLLQTDLVSQNLVRQESSIIVVITLCLIHLQKRGRVLRQL